MTPTTLLAVREATAAVILAIVPQHAEYQDCVWSRVRSIKDVPGGIRTFLVRPLPTEEVLDGFFGDGYDVSSIVQVWTSYAGLADDADGPIISSDRRQIYNRLVQTATDPTVPAIRAWVPLGWTYEDETPGKVWGHHDFLCTFLTSDQT